MCQMLRALIKELFYLLSFRCKKVFLKLFELKLLNSELIDRNILLS